MVFDAFTIGFVLNTMALVSDTLGYETNTMVTKPATIFRLTGKMAFVANTMVFVIGTMALVIITMVETSDTTVMVAKKIVLVAKTMVFKVLTIGYLIVKQSFANPNWVFVFGHCRKSARWQLHHPRTSFSPSRNS
jgi:hypothetical protein